MSKKWYRGRIGKVSWQCTLANTREFGFPALHPRASLKCHTGSGRSRRPISRAIGRGLSISPADIEVSLEGENEHRFHSINGESERGRNWSIIPFTPATNFSASVVVEAGPAMIRYFHWEPRRLLNSRLP